MPDEDGAEEGHESILDKLVEPQSGVLKRIGDCSMEDLRALHKAALRRRSSHN